MSGWLMGQGTYQEDGSVENSEQLALFFEDDADDELSDCEGNGNYEAHENKLMFEFRHYYFFNL
jgi:hypothetical protein